MGEALRDDLAQQQAAKQPLADRLDGGAGTCPLCGVARRDHYDQVTRVLLSCVAAADLQRQRQGGGA